MLIGCRYKTKEGNAVRPKKQKFARFESTPPKKLPEDLAQRRRRRRLKHIEVQNRNTSGQCGCQRGCQRVCQRGRKVLPPAESTKDTEIITPTTALKSLLSRPHPRALLRSPPVLEALQPCLARSLPNLRRVGNRHKSANVPMFTHIRNVSTHDSIFSRTVWVLGR